MILLVGSLSFLLGAGTVIAILIALFQLYFVPVD